MRVGLLVAFSVSRRKWSEREDSNLRLLRPERSALTRLSHAPTNVRESSRNENLFYYLFTALQLPASFF